LVRKHVLEKGQSILNPGTKRRKMKKLGWGIYPGQKMRKVQALSRDSWRGIKKKDGGFFG